MKAYSYIRWSSVKQSEGHSGPRQAGLAAAWSKQHKVPLDNSTYRDAGISAFKGKNALEGKLGAFLKAIDTGKVETPCYLLVEALDRITRLELLKAMRLFISIVENNVT